MYNSKELGNLSDRELLAQSRLHEAKITADPASFNFTAAQAAEIKAVNDAFEEWLDQWDAVQSQMSAVSTGKTGGRKIMLKKLRDQRSELYADKSLGDAILASVNMPPRDKIKTDSPAPTSAPIGWLDYAKLKHILYFRNAATPDKKGKPKGMLGCEIWYFISDAPPVSEEDFRYLATDTNSPYDVYFEMKDAGKKVWYLLRWISKSGERGTWSEMIEATING